jgi:Flp pilus assembly pilin Flp
MKMKELWQDELGASTAEYAIITLAAVGFAGILLAILRSEEVKTMLLDLVRSALSVSGS